MEQINTVLLNMGFGGAMSAAFVWLTYTIVTKVLPDMISSAKDAISREREEFLKGLRDQRDEHTKAVEKLQNSFKDALLSMEENWRATTEAICGKIDQLSNRVDRLDLHTQTSRKAQ